MHRKLRAAAAAAILAAATAAGPAAAQSQDPSEERERSPEDLAREGAETLMRALQGLLEAIPQYGVPRIEENGDIVIPRLNPPKKREDGTGDGGEGEGEDGEITETDI